jgi:hypothetical protein
MMVVMRPASQRPAPRDKRHPRVEQAAQAAAGVSTPDAGDPNGSAAEAVQLALLQKALEMERSTVNILA